LSASVHYRLHGLALRLPQQWPHLDTWRPRANLVLAGCSRGDLEQQGDVVRGLRELGSGGATQQEGVEGG
jgi:hypothetical protein